MNKNLSPQKSEKNILLKMWAEKKVDGINEKYVDQIIQQMVTYIIGKAYDISIPQRNRKKKFVLNSPPKNFFSCRGKKKQPTITPHPHISNGASLNPLNSSQNFITCQFV